MWPRIGKDDIIAIKVIGTVKERPSLDLAQLNSILQNENAEKIESVEFDVSS